MNFPFYIARRYLFAKKTHNIINIISLISVFGIAMGTLALVVVLSVFNGFENLVSGLFNTFNPDIKITAVEGKTFEADSLMLKKIGALKTVACITQVMEENALLKYRDKQYIVTLKGVSSGFECTSGLKNSIVEGEFRLESGNNYFAVVGQGIAYNLGLALNDFENPLTVYAPVRNHKKTLDVADAFNMEKIMPSGIFGIQQDFDNKYVIVPLDFCRILLQAPDRLSALEIKLSETADLTKAQQEIQQTAGTRFKVQNRFQQEELLFKIMKSEKLAVFIILAFILIIAAFNVIGSLSMLILDKRKDIKVLKSLGATQSLIRRIFITEGMMISMSGAVIGIILGFIICFVQQQFGLITIQNSGSFVVNAYPVKMEIPDFIYVLIIDFIIGFAAAWYPVKYLSKRFFLEKLQ